VKPFAHAVRCPWCAKQLTHHGAPFDKPQTAPEDGDTALCVGCGELCVFDAEAPDGARRPSSVETDELRRDPFVARMRMAWRKLVLPPRKTRH